MVINPIQAVVFDMGGTLEDVTYDDITRLEATRGLRDVLRKLDLDPGLSLPDLQDTVTFGLEAYYTWRGDREVELSPERVWTEYIFPDHGICTERLLAAADDLALFYETHFYTRSLRCEAPAALEALQTRDLRLAVISNTFSRQLVPLKLAEYGIARCFDPVVTSASLGWRKPNERIFEQATGLMQIPPESCVYVGDTLSRDVIGARRAGWGMVIQIESFLTAISDQNTAPVPPDAVIDDLREIVDLITSSPGDCS